ncbi:CopD family protein [Polaromonas vacuolata]|nr:CopD family protein [Polaromonas vacuolata]
MKLLHLFAAIVWLGGISFMLYALRPTATALMQAPERLTLTAAVLQRFFIMVWLTIALLLLSGVYMLTSVGMKNAPAGWHVMLTLGLVMMALFGHLYFGPFRRLKLAVVASNWEEAGRRAGQVSTLAATNLALGAIAISGVILLV